MVSNIKVYDTKENRKIITDYLKEKYSPVKAISMTINFFDNPSSFDENEVDEIIKMLEPKGKKQKFSKVTLINNELIYQ